ncbi:hypothetical protein ABH966_003519 [Lysinibacillus sp. RC46]|uniref:hypothetical protein n=1 Tax=Lysinibacillus sp. RC46 TaxID=3156295 RepID=UPI003515EFDB
MTIETHENKYLKNCLNCDNEISDLKEDHIYCTQCGFPIRNECTGTSKFCSGYGNEPIQHDSDEEEYILDPNVAFCPKCAAPSLFNKKQLIEVKHPKVEVVKQTGFKYSEDEIPF